MDETIFGLRGYVIDAPEFGTLRARRDGAVLVEKGRIAAVGDYEDIRRTDRGRNAKWNDPGGVAIFPGLIDCHTHLPQYPAVARGQSELLPWLRENIFPVEREFSGPKAREEAPQFFHQLARHGTTTAMVYSAIYEESCDAGFEAAEKSGLRIILGKMMMDLGSYGTLQPKKILSVSLLESERLCRKWHGAADGRLEYAFSPRFAVTCSEKLLRSAAELAKQFGAYIQTHLSENREEIEKVHHLYMTARDYTDVYEKAGLLTPKTVLGHCIHLQKREIAAIAEARA
ncbi:MAG: amidohydrolase family protein, partial [Verrucomicrobiota bacterium]|nr:amidohydrolase family protein [Verrucomicrobiota bacterium]